MSLPVAILAGGLATRLKPLTETIPKSLVEVAGRPFVVHQIELVRRKGLRRAVFCLGHQGEAIEATLGDGRSFGMKFEYVYDGPQLLGTGGALRRALSKLGEKFFVLYGDSYLDADYAAVERSAQLQGRLGMMTVFRNAGRWDTSNVLYDNGRILRYDKRSPTPEMRHIDYGLSVLTAPAVLRIPENERYDLADLLESLVREGELAGYEVDRRFYEIGSPSGLAEFEEYLAARKETSDGNVQ